MKVGNLFLVAGAAGTAMASPFQWFGINESGPEFGEGNLPGVWGKDYIFPDAGAMQTLAKTGMNIFRVQFLMERLTPSGMTGSFDEDYLQNLTSTVNTITQAGGYAVIDPHNFGRFNGAVITSTADFQSFWKNVAGRFKSNARVIFDTNNEYHDMDQTLVLNLNQAAINGIRAAGATSQYIFVEGNSYTGAWTWTTVNDNLKNLQDPQDKIVYEMHQYLDSDGSGTHEACVSTTIGKERVTAATQWLIDNGKVGILGEFAGGVNDQCKTAITGMLDYLAAHNDVWKGAVWWAAGPWWGDYMFNMEPSTGVAYTGILPILKKYI
ncbi:putative endo-beta-1,4-glucanase [Penicillium oxalicum 114-2]|uniref:cellulase n=1 Tax=Penicillium oxalicum (strain 114-2 / CGMCC 5302) TaxID=933388 RepID=S8AVG6_PENO1|nr:putative endo-beta-1,4-glucanase [Penicillium oxalicum 114-2]